MDKEAQETIRELFEKEKTDEMLKYIQLYADSTESPDEKDKTSKKARELYSDNPADEAPEDAVVGERRK